MGLRRWCDGAQRPVQSLGSFGSGFCGPGSSAPQSNLDWSLSVAGRDTTPAAFFLAGASDAKRQNTKVKMSVIPKKFNTEIIKEVKRTIICNI